ncbi:acetoin utilization protein AcuC [Tumebacillus algifaecis]|uniref:Acetoin utilization protein AcuC n=1 Tax=Tumebacillus algifaecis TaxID=1214604 RepID=A0A223D0H5_9BACL|nr:acetoin utilization protein AcuC [Tumebacillus algifaecis]ASS74867.1 acetoin utilization protein AcuC [Tumebacillus algifaecis]
MVANGKSAFIYSDAFTKYKFAEEHPFNPKRLEMTLDLIKTIGFLDADQIITPRMATQEELARVHDTRYLDAVQAASQPQANPDDFATWGLGTEDTPIFAGMHEATSLIAGGTLLAADLVMSGQYRYALNMAGGLHHARRAEASGFCVYNDIAVAIAHVREKYGARVAYIDTDAHHGDGVQWIFYEDPDVLTISLHETGKYLYPGTGEIIERGEGRGYGYAVNVPLEAFTEDDSWMNAVRSVIIPTIQKFAPDIIFHQNGCDAHTYDPLTHLSASTHIYREMPKITRLLAEEMCDGRLVAVGGGGYDIWRVVPRAWTMLWAELNGNELPERLPKAWLERWQLEASTALPEFFLDPPGSFEAIPRRAEIEEKNEIMVRRVLNGTPFLY